MVGKLRTLFSTTPLNLKGCDLTLSYLVGVFIRLNFARGLMEALKVHQKPDYIYR